jgi:hypothetical protein
MRSKLKIVLYGLQENFDYAGSGFCNLWPRHLWKESKICLKILTGACILNFGPTTPRLRTVGMSRSTGTQGAVVRGKRVLLLRIWMRRNWFQMGYRRRLESISRNKMHSSKLSWRNTGIQAVIQKNRAHNASSDTIGQNLHILESACFYVMISKFWRFVTMVRC